MIESILPAGVAVHEEFADPAEATLFPEEEAAVARAVDGRRREFTTARWCARQALWRLGLPATPILPGPDREPRWPEGVIGSITHCDGYRAAAVAIRGQVCSIGIDAEPNGPLPPGVLQAVALPAERTHLRRLPVTDPPIHWDRLIFSAKESVYKAWFPLAGRWLGFEDAVVSVYPDGGFAADLTVTAPVASGVEVTSFTGRWLVRDGLILTAVSR